MSIIIDSSAILALIRNEAGADIVAAALEDAATSTVMLAEVYSFAARNLHPLEAYNEFFQASRIEIVALGHGEAVLAGELMAATAPGGLSLADRCCLALAKSRDATVLTADRAWLPFAAPLGLDIRLVR